MLDDKLLTLSRNVETARSASRATKEALDEERWGASEMAKEAITEYKWSPRFELGMQRLGLVTYEFRYQVALARFRAKYLDLKVE